MAEQKKAPRYDIDGFDVVTAAVRALINQYPGLNNGEEIAFSTLGEDAGKALFPISGAVIETERESITGWVRQVCLYPFYVIYRAGGLSENRKAAVKEWLDNLGRWLERQAVTIDGKEYRLESYPLLTGERKFLSIARQTPAYLDRINDNQSEDWAISLSARYQNEFER